MIRERDGQNRLTIYVKHYIMQNMIGSGLG